MSPTTNTTEQLAGTWELDRVHSTAGFAVKHMVVATFRGRFEEFDASISDGKLTGTVKVASIVVKDENLAAHLQAPDFFDGERYPEIRYESGDIRVDGDEVVVDGELTIKGHSTPVQACGQIAGPGEDIAGNTKLGISLETIIDRTEFGLNWNAPLPKGGVALANDVKLSVELELVQKA